jgi:hypothetical protein
MATLLDRLNDLTAIAESAQKAAVAAAGFVVMGLGGIVVAVRKIKSQLAVVESQVAPPSVATEKLLVPDDTLRQKVHQLADNYANDKAMRDAQHVTNTQKLDELKEQVAEQRGELREIRQLLQRVISKMAGL